MPRPYASGVISAPVDQVWPLVRDFGAISDWHPVIAASELTSGTAAEIGAVRRLTLGDGGVVVETLVELDDADRRVTYTIEESPFPVRRYVSTIRIAPITADGSTFVEWWAEFDADADDETGLAELFAGGVFAGGIGGLAQRLSG